MRSHTTRLPHLALALIAGASPALADGHAATQALTYGPRPAYLVSQMDDGPLKTKLESCLGQTPSRSAFSIGHRGAPLMFPEHTVQANVAAAQMGAGILECDVTFTADHELVCRHAQNDLHTTTNILVSDLAPKCTAGFTPAAGDTNATAECRTSDITLAEFRTLTPKMDAADGSATTPEDYQGGTAGFRTDLYAANTDLMTHAESIALCDSLGA
ncbi:MAG: glycerophosphodiester phosphodiesterase family protein, partial [Jannaschia sp.]